MEAVEVVRQLWEMKKLMDFQIHKLNRQILLSGERFYGTIVFCQQSLKGRSKEAQMVRDGLLKQSDVFWLYFWHRGQRIWLAKVIQGDIEIIRPFKVKEKVWLV